tara:strand:- start:160 stop:417 length:258 start_codon:yes stop_codon:yes gene_type:complete
MLVALIFFGVLFFVVKSEFNQGNMKISNTVKKNEVLHKCNLSNEIINRENIDNERQCYYDCGDDFEVRVDTSIEFPCQNYIMEKK